MANVRELKINGIDIIEYILDFMYPIGSIYLSFDSTDPSTIMGGTWEQIIGNSSSDQDRFLLLTNTSNPAGNVSGSIGGEATHTLTVNEMPSHSHRQYVTANSGGHGTRMDYNSDKSGLMHYDQGIDTGPKGGGQAHNNMPPYMRVYGWKRVS